MNIKEEINLAVSTGNCVIVDFYKDNCAPCKNVERQLSAIEKEYPDITIIKVKFGHSTEGDDLFAEHNLKSVPALFLYKDKALVTVVGALHKSKILSHFGIMV